MEMQQMTLPKLASQDDSQKAIQNIMDVFFVPEMIKRQSINLLPKPFPFNAAQLVMYSDRPNSIRFNEEVQCSDWRKPINDFKLPEVDANAGHITVFFKKGALHLVFDCRYDKNQAYNLIRVAEQHISLTETSLKNNFLNAFVDNLFTGLELLLKADLLLMAEPGVKTTKSHKFIHSRSNLKSRSILSLKPAVSVFNKLSNLRDKHRYKCEEPKLSFNECKEMIKTIKSLYCQMKKHFPQDHS